MNGKKRKVIILSGGMDSLVALALNAPDINQGRIICLTFNYGSRHNRQEILAAERIAKHYSVEHLVFELPFIHEHFKSALLDKESSEDIPLGHYEDISMQKTVVPFRNGIMLSIAVGLAESREFDSVVIGSHAGDHAIYPDCRDNFYFPFFEAVKSGTYRAIDIEFPFISMRKSQIAMLGHQLFVPFEMSYSCYQGRELHCGECGTCTERKEAFRLIGVRDPTKYESHEKEKPVN